MGAVWTFFCSRCRWGLFGRFSFKISFALLLIIETKHYITSNRKDAPALKDYLAPSHNLTTPTCLVNVSITPIDMTGT